MVFVYREKERRKDYLEVVRDALKKLRRHILLRDFPRASMYVDVILPDVVLTRIARNAQLRYLEDLRVFQSSWVFWEEYGEEVLQKLLVYDMDRQNTADAEKALTKQRKKQASLLKAQEASAKKHTGMLAAKTSKEEQKAAALVKRKALIQATSSQTFTPFRSTMPSPHPTLGILPPSPQSASRPFSQVQVGQENQHGLPMLTPTASPRRMQARLLPLSPLQANPRRSRRRLPPTSPAPSVLQTPPPTPASSSAHISRFI